MANRYLLNDFGNVIFYQGQVWTKLGTSIANAPDPSPGGSDVGNIAASGTLNYADAQARNSYTAEEMGVGANIYPVAAVLLPGYSTVTVVASVPVSGVFRGWDSIGSGSITWKVNGIAVAGPGISRDSFVNSVPFNVAIGDHIEATIGHPSSVTVYGFLIPFTYTNPG